MEREPSFPNAPTSGPGLIPMEHEELLIRDIRDGVSPAQMVERKLASLDEGRPGPQGGMRTAALARPA